jgi:hypothetical protein
MKLHEEQAHAITGAVWLFGLAALFYTGRWWPGILFLIGASAIIEGLIQGQGWYALQGEAWVIGIGVWALMNFQLWFLFVLLGVSVLLGAFVPPPMLAKKPRSRYETDLE